MGCGSLGLRIVYSGVPQMMSNLFRFLRAIGIYTAVLAKSETNRSSSAKL
jgi:hypothetical protein